MSVEVRWWGGEGKYEAKENVAGSGGHAFEESCQVNI